MIKIGYASLIVCDMVTFYVKYKQTQCSQCVAKAFMGT